MDSRFSPNNTLPVLVITLAVEVMNTAPSQAIALINSHYEMACATLDSDISMMDTAMMVEACYKFKQGNGRYVEDADNGIDSVWFVSVQTGESVSVISNDAMQIVGVEW